MKYNMSTMPLKKTKLTVACVPEQVNIPIMIAVEKRITSDLYNLDLEVKLVPEGTGKMLDMLERHEADVAITVTDAFMVANSKGRQVQLAGTFVSSPLVWAMAASPSLPKEIKSLKELVAFRAGQPLRIGISRMGSGSHTMASYMAMLHNLSCPLTFHVANTISGLTAGVQNNEFDLFLWETFTTKPLFDSNELRYIGEVKTPWPAFSIVTSRLKGEEGSALIHALQTQLFPALFDASKLFTSDHEVAANRIVKEFGHQLADAQLWLNRVQYNGHSSMAIDLSVLRLSWEILQQVGLIGKDAHMEDLWVTTTVSKPREETNGVDHVQSEEEVEVHSSPLGENASEYFFQDGEISSGGGEGCNESKSIRTSSLDSSDQLHLSSLALHPMEGKTFAINPSLSSSTASIRTFTAATILFE